MVPLALALYLAAAGSLPVTVDMSQASDDALYVRLGMSIANGHWLGPYNALILTKGPIYPLFLVVASVSGLSFNVAQYTFYFFSCWYFSIVLVVVCRLRGFVAPGIFLLLLTCPAFYTVDRVLREPFYTGLTLLLLAVVIDFLFVERLGWPRVALGVGAGVVAGAYWLTREEGVWIIPSLVILVIGAAVNWQGLTLRERILALRQPVLTLAIGAAAVVVAIGFLNRNHYGRFVTNEVKDATFQRAMVALQRVGSTFHRSFLPVPYEARELIYAQSPSFAGLRGYLEPTAEYQDPLCSRWKYTCGDIAGSWFMWRLRDAVAKAGFAHSAKDAARFYRGLAKEIETACQEERLPCTSWLPPLIPPITSPQWQQFPDSFTRAASLVVYMPWPNFDCASKSESANIRAPNHDCGANQLDTIDSAAAMEFLNRPLLTGSHATQTTSRMRLRAIWIGLLGQAASADRIVLAFGGASLILVVFLARRVTISTTGIIVLAFLSAVLARIGILALTDISSFENIYHFRMAPADPLALAAAVLSIYLLWTVKRPSKIA